MPLKNQTSGRWVRGLNSAFDVFAQPKGSVPRVSNMVLLPRGAWKTCDGSKIISAAAGSAALGFNPPISRMWKELFYYQPSAGGNAYFGLLEDPNVHINGSVGSIGLFGQSSANPLTGHFYFVVTALDGAGGETAQSVEANITVAGQAIQVTWSSIPTAYGYNVYMGTAPGNETLRIPPAVFAPGWIGPSVVGPSVTSLVVDATFFDTRLPAPTVDTTQSCLLLTIPITVTGWGGANIIKVLPADNIVRLDGDRGGGYGGKGGGGGGGGNRGTGGGTIAGGVAGVIDAIPQIIQFADKMFLALGNGISPYISDGTGPGTTPISNTFQATYPAWAASTAFNQGDSVQATVGGTPYLFTAVQGGITNATAAPTWPATLNKTVNDGSGSKIIWKNSGQVSTSPPPRGAAHVEVYAGSIWVANTSPSITADQLDGPSAVRMSDANNPNSWNPLNSAQVAKDDGQQITGLKSFAVAAAGIPTTNQLAVFKDFSTYVINGVFGASNFAIQQAQTDMGCSAPRTIQYLPGFGLIRLAHLGFAIFDGLYDKVVSEEVRPYLFGGQDDIVPIDWGLAYFAKGAQFANPPMYVAAVPLLGANSSLLGALTGISVGQTGVLGSVTLPPGQYYVKVSLKGPIYETAITGELGPVTVTSTRGIDLIGPTVPSGYLGYRAYFGIGQGSENQFIDFRDLNVPGSYFSDPGTPGLPPTGLIGSLTRLLCYDLVLKAWTVIDLPFSISVLRQFRSPGHIPLTLSAGFYDGTIRRLFDGDPNWDGVPVNWSLQPAESYVEGGTQKVFYRRVVIRGVGATSPKSISLTPSFNGADDVPLSPTMRLRAFGSKEFEASFSLMRTLENYHSTLSGSGPIEIDSHDLQVVERAVGSSLVIS